MTNISSSINKMLVKEKEFVKQFLPYLQENVEIDVDLIARLRKFAILPEKDIEKLWIKQERQGSVEAVQFMFRALEQQSSECFYNLLLAFTQCNKHFVTDKLLKSVKKKPKIKDELRQRVETEVFSKINRSLINVGVLSEIANKTVTKQDYDLLYTQKSLLQSEVELLRTKLQATETTVQCQKEHSEFMKKTFEDQINKLNTNLKEEQEKLSRNNIHIENYKYDNDKLGRDNKYLLREIDGQNEKKKDLLRQIDDQNKNIEEQQNSIVALTRNIDSLQKQINELPKKFETGNSNSQFSKDNEVALHRCIKDYKEIDIKVTATDNKLNQFKEHLRFLNHPRHFGRSKHLLNTSDEVTPKRQRTISQQSDSSSGNSVYTDAPSSVGSSSYKSCDVTDGLDTYERNIENIEYDVTQAGFLTKNDPGTTSNNNDDAKQTQTESKLNIERGVLKTQKEKGSATKLLKHSTSLPEIRRKQGKYQPPVRSLSAISQVRCTTSAHVNRQSLYQNRESALKPVNLGEDLNIFARPRTGLATRRAQIPARRITTTRETIVVEEHIGQVPQMATSVQNSHTGCVPSQRASSTTFVRNFKERSSVNYDPRAGIALDGVSYSRVKSNMPE